MSKEMSKTDEEVMELEVDAGPPVLQECVSQSDTSLGDETSSAQVDPENVLRSPPKLLPAVVVGKRKSDEFNTSPFKHLTGSMKNTPASLSIIDGPSSVGKSTRSTRSSIDPSFAAKQRSFLNKVHNALSVRPDETSSCESDAEVNVDEDEASDDRSPEYIPGLEDIPRRVVLNGSHKRRREDSPLNKGKMAPGIVQEHIVNNITPNEVTEPSPKKKVPPTPTNGKIRDIFCWSCHREDSDRMCASCPRAFHSRCVRKLGNVEAEWVCPECLIILRAENQETRSKALKLLSLDQLCKLLLFAVDRMKSCSGADVFENPVDLDKFPTYKDYIVNPMCLSLLEKNIKRKMYGSTEAFLADSLWIVHNCIIFNSFNSKLTSIAKNILRICRHEMSEIENCPDCYNYAYTEDENWFIQVCQKPHVLVWAKVKGFPFWPAKAMRVNSEAVDVRFFGAHDRAWVPARECYLYSEENPNPNAPSKVPPANPQQKKRNPRNNLDACIEEVELHIQLLKKRFPTFQYAPLKVAINVKKLDDHLKYMLPDYASTEPIAVSQTLKNPLVKRRSFDLKSVPTGPSIKRMKADSSSPPPTNIMHLFKISSAAKENGGLKAEGIIPAKGASELLAKVVASTVSIDSIPKFVSDCKQNGTSALKENGKASQSKRICNSVTLHTVTPGQSNTFITPLTTPDASNIAELRLKKKDARKIGLIDRLQQKLGLLVSQSEGPKDELATNLTETEGSDQSSESQTPGNESDEKLDEGKSDTSPAAEVSCEKPCEDVSPSNKTGEEPPKAEVISVKRDLFAGAKPVSKESMNQILQTFNISKDQPKLVLKKLVLQSNDKSSVQSEIQISPVKLESVSSDEESEECDSPTNGNPIADNIQKVTVSSLELVPDDEDSSSGDRPEEESPAEENVMPVVKPKSSTEPADPVTSTTPPNTAISPPVKMISGKISVQFNGPKPVTETEPNLVNKSADRILAKPGPKSKKLAALTAKRNGKEKSSLATIEPKDEPPAEPEDQPKSREEPELQSEGNLTLDPEMAAEPESARTEANATKGAKLEKIPNVPAKGKKKNVPKVPQPVLKIVTKPFVIRAKPISELRDLIDHGLKIPVPQYVSSKPTGLADIEDTSVSSTLASENDSCSKNDTEMALKSLIAKNVTVRLETNPASDNKGAVKDSEKLSVGSSSSESTVRHTVSVSLPNAKATTVVVQSGGNMKQGESPPRNVPSSTVATSPTHRCYGATSVLKVKNTSQTDGSVPVITGTRDQTIKVLSPRLFAVASNAGAAKTLNASSPSSLSSSVTKTPTFVTVSQAATGIPIVRRILPKAIPLSAGASIQYTAKSVSPVAQVIGSPPSTAAALDSSTKVLGSRITVRPLVATSSASAASPKVTNSQDDPLKSPEMSLLKASPRISVGPVWVPPVASSSCLREMPTLSIASVCSLKPVSTVQANAGSTALHTSSSPQVHISSSETSSKLSLSTGPVSSELKSHANKMTEVFMGCLKDCLSEMGSMGSLEAQVRCLQLDMEHLQWRHKQEMEELRHNTELIVSEIRDRMKVESQQAVTIALANASKEKEMAVSAAVSAAKEKQWCAFCKKEAMFYCCWNTSYCDHHCQQNHWPVHSLTCTQNAASSAENDSLSTMEKGPAQPANMGRIFIRHKEVLSPPLLKKR